jgi:hypothetical protein
VQGFCYVLAALAAVITFHKCMPCLLLFSLVCTQFQGYGQPTVVNTALQCKMECALVGCWRHDPLHHALSGFVPSPMGCVIHLGICIIVVQLTLGLSCSSASLPCLCITAHSMLPISQLQLLQQW